MSMYNMLHGVNPLGGQLLAIIDPNAKAGDFGRFRDIYIAKDPKTGVLTIVVYTRNGGGNREGHQEVFERWSKHPNFVRDWDDDFDCTYASLEFSVPEEHKALAEFLYDANDEKRTPQEKFRDMLHKLQNEPGSPEAQAAMAKFRPIVDQIAALAKGAP